MHRRLLNISKIRFDINPRTPKHLIFLWRAAGSFIGEIIISEIICQSINRSLEAILYFLALLGNRY